MKPVPSPQARKRRLLLELPLALFALLLAYILLGFPMFTPRQAAEATQTRYLFGPAELLELARLEPDGDQFCYVGQTGEFHCVICVTRRGLFWYSGYVNSAKIDPDAPIQVIGASPLYRFTDLGFVLFSNDPAITQIEVEYIYDYEDARPLLRRVSRPMTGTYCVVLPNDENDEFESIRPLSLDDLRFYGYDASGARVYTGPEPDTWKEAGS